MTKFPYKNLQVSAGGGPVPRARALIFNPNGEILLVKHNNLGFWALPGGKVDALESSETAIRRELLEEMELEVPDLRLRFIAELPHINSIEFFFVGTTEFLTTENLRQAVETGELQDVAFHPFGSAEAFRPGALAAMTRQQLFEEGVEYLGIWTT